MFIADKWEKVNVKITVGSDVYCSFEKKNL